MTINLKDKDICLFCGSSDLISLYNIRSARIPKDKLKYSISQSELNVPMNLLRCNSCGLVVSDFKARNVLDFYVNMKDERYLAEEDGRRFTAKYILKILNRIVKSGKRILEICPSAGFFLDEARKSGWEVYGIEPSKWAVDYAKERLGIIIENRAFIENTYKDNYFDAIIMQDVIEHLSAPKDAILRAKKILKPGGVLFINTPDFDNISSKLFGKRWWGINIFHLCYFSKRTLRLILNELGFKVVKERSLARTFSFVYWLERFRPYNKFLYSCLSFVVYGFGLKHKVVTFNLMDQTACFAVKKQTIQDINRTENISAPTDIRGKKNIVVLPAYNAEKTLEITFNDIPKDIIDEIILVDDASSDNTLQVAKRLGIKVIAHSKNKGYGANQKTCYIEALKSGADIIIMVHPDYQYDPTVIPEMIRPILEGRADAVFGSRMMKGGALIGGMPKWKHNANIALTALENIIFGTYLTEYHSGFRAYSANLLRKIRFCENSDNFVFDTEIIAQILTHNFKIEEIPICTRYFDEASSIRFWPCVIYGFGILRTLLKYILHVNSIISFKQFEIDSGC